MRFGKKAAFALALTAIAASHSLAQDPPALEPNRSLPTQMESIPQLPDPKAPATVKPKIDLKGVVVLGSRNFGIPFNVDSSGTRPAEVRLYGSSGKGTAWKLLDRQAPTVKEFQFKGTRDGVYWFTTQTIDVSGRAFPKTIEEPQLRVYVDSSKPHVNLLADADPQGLVEALLDIEDDTPIKSIQLHYATDVKRKWTSLDDRLPANGKLRFLPKENWTQLSLQAIVMDTAGNQTIVSRLLQRPRVAAGPKPKLASTNDRHQSLTKTAQFRTPSNRPATAAAAGFAKPADDTTTKVRMVSGGIQTNVYVNHTPTTPGVTNRPKQQSKPTAKIARKTPLKGRPQKRTTRSTANASGNASGKVDPRSKDPIALRTGQLRTNDFAAAPSSVPEISIAPMAETPAPVKSVPAPISMQPSPMVMTPPAPTSPAPTKAGSVRPTPQGQPAFTLPPNANIPTKPARNAFGFKLPPQRTVAPAQLGINPNAPPVPSGPPTTFAPTENQGTSIAARPQTFGPGSQAGIPDYARMAAPPASVAVPSSVPANNSLPAPGLVAPILPETMSPSGMGLAMPGAANGQPSFGSSFGNSFGPPVAPPPAIGSGMTLPGTHAKVAPPNAGEMTLPGIGLPDPATPEEISGHNDMSLSLPTDPMELGNETVSESPPTRKAPRTPAEAMRPIEDELQTELTAPGQAKADQLVTSDATKRQRSRDIDRDSADYKAMRASQEQYDRSLLAGRAPMRFSDSVRFSLEYELEAVGANGTEAVELYGSTDGGRSWKRWGTDPDMQSPFDIETKDDGVFAFRIVVVSRNGLASPRPLPNDSPDIVVVVDRSKPDVRITAAKYGEGNRAGSLVVRYNVADHNLTERPIALAFSDSPQGPWTSIAAGLRNNGEYVWPGDPELPREIYLRIDAKDKAGNIGTYVLERSIDARGLAPRARIRGFKSLGENRSVSSRDQTAQLPVQRRKENLDSQVPKAWLK